jgi:hypothetical protein
MDSKFSEAEAALYILADDRATLCLHVSWQCYVACSSPKGVVIAVYVGLAIASSLLPK